MRKTILLLHTFLFILQASAQRLQPGFDKSEFIELLKISAVTAADTGYSKRLPPPQRFSMKYRSRVLGLDNRWDLWDDGNGIGVISIRGTTRKQASWLENFYAAMVPAKGELQLAQNETFAYTLTNQPQAAVHVGWLVGMAFLGRDVLPQIDAAYKAGTKAFLLVGHSQGGAIAYLLTAWLRQLQKDGKLPPDLRLKTYCSAAPKPGNLPFAYAYEAMTQGGWAFNVVNSADWVPETPASIQTLDDFNRSNPFSGAKQTIRKINFPANLALRHVYNRLDKSTKKARRTYRRYLGQITGAQVRKRLAGFRQPKYFNSNHYVRTGSQVVLLADSAYFARYPDTAGNVFTHHLHAPYLFLVQQLPEPLAVVAGTLPHKLEGSWELSFIAGASSSVIVQFPNQKPIMNIDVANCRVNGSTGCNPFDGVIRIEQNRLRFSDSLATTRMMCPGGGEQMFLESLQRVNSYAFVNEQTLLLLQDERELMRLVRK